MAEMLDFQHDDHYLGKGEVESSILSNSTILSRSFPKFSGAGLTSRFAVSCRTTQEHASNMRNCWGKSGEVR